MQAEASLGLTEPKSNGKKARAGETDESDDESSGDEDDEDEEDEGADDDNVSPCQSSTRQWTFSAHRMTTTMTRSQPKAGCASISRS